MTDRLIGRSRSAVFVLVPEMALPARYPRSCSAVTVKVVNSRMDSPGAGVEVAGAFWLQSPAGEKLSKAANQSRDREEG
jgi:hypothetical protein